MTDSSVALISNARVFPPAMQGGASQSRLCTEDRAILYEMNGELSIGTSTDKD